MMTREDMRFSTCYQLAELIASDWDDRPEAVSNVIAGLFLIDEPDGTFVGAGLAGSNSLRLKAYETEPEAIRNVKRLAVLCGVIEGFKIILKYSDGWQTEHSDNLKKELILRIDNYEDEIKQITFEEPARCQIRL